MFTRLPRLLTYSTLLGALLLFGCGSKPILVSKSAGVPVGVDLSGNWLVRANPMAKRFSAVGEERNIHVPTSGPQRSGHGQGQGHRQGRSGGSRGGRSGGESVRVFLEYGESLKITQTYFGLFISYDRSVVEEYTYGENRLATIGPIGATRVSGWEGQSFVVETMDDSGTILYESWHLEEDAAVLIRDIRISRGEKDSFAHQQVFNRQ
jgi:hypothetical protein